jgi:hypothetical protein
MRALNASSHGDGDLSWTNEALPLEVRRALLDKALEDLRIARAAGSPRNATSSERPGLGGRGPAPGTDKPQA